MTRGYGLHARPPPEAKPPTSGLEAVFREAVSPGSGVDVSPEARRVATASPAPESIEWDAIYHAINQAPTTAEGTLAHGVSVPRKRHVV